MDTAATGYPPGDLRVSDADRDRALGELSEAFQAGRITAAEFDQRSGQALHARTGKELAALLSDLPRDHPPAHAPRTTAVDRAHRVLAARAAMGASAVTAVCLSAVAVTNALSNGGVNNSGTSKSDTSAHLQLAREVLARLGLPIPRALYINPVNPVSPVHPGFDWAGTITPAAIAVLLVVAIIVLARVSRVQAGARVARCGTA
jgi:hypothetical protein